MRSRRFECFAVGLTQSAQRERLTLIAGDFKTRVCLAVGREPYVCRWRAAVLRDRRDLFDFIAPRFKPRRRRLREVETKGVIACRRVKARGAKGADHALGDARREQRRLFEPQQEGLPGVALRPDQLLAAIGGDDIAARLQRAFEAQPVHRAARLCFDGLLLERRDRRVRRRRARRADRSAPGRSPQELTRPSAPTSNE